MSVSTKTVTRALLTSGTAGPLGIPCSGLRVRAMTTASYRVWAKRMAEVKSALRRDLHLRDIMSGQGELLQCRKASNF